MVTNTLYPGKPNYKGPKSGYFTLLHHEGPLVEWSHNVMERVHYIKAGKDENEVPIRLRHIVLIPRKLIPKNAQQADAAWQQAYAAWQQAYAAKQQADAAWQQVDAASQQADAAWQQVDAGKLTAYLLKHVKNCLWDGTKIVFR